MHAITDSQYFPSSLVSDNAGKLRLDRVEPAGQEHVVIVDGRVLNANQNLTRFGTVRFRNLREPKTVRRLTVLRQLDGLHQPLPFTTPLIKTEGYRAAGAAGATSASQGAASSMSLSGSF